MLTYLEANKAKADRYGVLFLHAFPLSASMWQPQLQTLGSAGLRLIAPNAWGIEGSEEKESWTFTDYAHELVALVDSLGIERVSVVGLSMGGYQAFELYRLYPEKIASLVLCDTKAEGDTPEARSLREAFIHAVEIGGADEAAGRMIPNFFTTGSYEMKPKLVDEAEAMITRQSAKVINATMRAIMTRNDATSLLASITCPVMVLNGAEDKVTTPATAELISSGIPGAELRLISGAGHISNMEQSEAFSCELLEHIEKVRRA
ncbi:MAG: alpha/beta fold hydrolase [Chlorobium sp.]|nr:MAG: alpha/beta fold hydrolase [Chlorobium sp.]